MPAFRITADPVNAEVGAAGLRICAWTSFGECIHADRFNAGVAVDTVFVLNAVGRAIGLNAGAKIGCATRLPDRAVRNQAACSDCSVEIASIAGPVATCITADAVDTESGAAGDGVGAR